MGDVLGFGDTLEPSISAGPNQVIRATGTIKNTTLCGLGGTNDFIFPAADVYIVKPGGEGGGLKEAGGGSPATIVSASAGGYVDEILGITAPGGTLGEGTYDVVVDECQDGRFDPGVDSIFPKAITVAFPPVIPSYTGYIGDIKAKAAKDALQWFYASTALDALRGELGMGDLAAAETDDPDASSVKAMLDKILAFISAHNLPSGGPWDVIGSGVNAAINEVKHYDAIASDPPDPDYKRPVVLPKVGVTLATSPAAPVAAIEGLDAPTQLESSINAAFLTALERYQGATQAVDPAWALIHAREVQNLATVLSAAQTRTAAAAQALSTALVDLPGFTALHNETQTLGLRIGTKGFTATETQALMNLGFSKSGLQQLRGTLWQQMECNECWYASPTGIPPYPNTTAGLQQALADLAAAENDSAASLTQLATRMDGVIGALTSQRSVPQTAPTADAGGPYTATAGTPLTLDASGSVAGQGESIDSYAWDLNGDGQFDDATGATPTVTLGVHCPGIVGVEVTGSDGQVAVAYAPVAVDLGTSPSIGARNPQDRFTTVTVGQPATYSVKPGGGIASWTLDGNAVGTSAPSYTLTATDDQVGDHDLQVTVTGTNGSQVTTDWLVRVLAVDADGDGWTATPDCNDADALVNPGRPEIIGNGIDDDCNPDTSDAPLSDFVGQAMSWGSTNAAVLGRQITTGMEADKPSNITGLGSIQQLAAGNDLGLAIDDQGRAWQWGKGAGNPWNNPAPVAVPALSGTGQLGATGEQVTAVTSNGQSAALLADGTVAAWGDNTNGALGTGNAAASTTIPALVEGPGGSPLEGVTHIAAGGSFLAMVTSDGSLYATGGICGTGLGTTAAKVAGLPGKVAQVAAGDGHLLVVLDDGSLYGCGANDHGQLGAPYGATVTTPRHITLPSGAAHPAQLAAGNGFSLVLDTSGAVWAFGRNDGGQLGVGTTSDTAVPTRITLPDGVSATQLAAGADSAALVRADGSVLQWGHGTATPTALPVPAGVRVAQIALDTAGTARYAIASRADAVLGWGDFWNWGGAGPGVNGVLAQPTLLDLPPLRDVASLNFTSVGVTDDGTVISWGGRGTDGSALGSGTSRSPGYDPEPVVGVGGAAGSQLRARQVYSTLLEGGFYALVDGGNLAEWGQGNYRWLHLQQDLEYSPVLVPDAGGVNPVSGITRAVTSPPNLAVTSDGSVLSWNGDWYADCQTADLALPTPVPALGNDVVKVAASYQGAGLFLKKDGSLWSCGEGVGPIGRLIDGGNTAAFDPNPGQVYGMGPGSVADVSAGLEQALALKTDGTVWAWGRNDNCSVFCSPDNSTPAKLIQLPVQVPLPPGPRVVSVQACLSEDYAIRADGSVLAWGYNNNDSLGLPDAGGVVMTPTVVHTPGDRPVWKIACANQGGYGDGALALVGDPVAHLANPDNVAITASVADTSVTEGGTAAVTVSLSHPAGLDLTLQYATADGSAKAGSDYTASSGTVTIPAGQTSATISVPTNGNDITQPSRMFRVTLSNPATSYGAAPWLSIGDAEALVTINDDDPQPVVSISAPAAPVTEGDGGETSAVFTVSLGHPSASTVTVDWATADGTATAPGDYGAGTGTTAFAPGQTTANVIVPVVGDTVMEPDETFGVALSHPVNASLGNASATARIADDEPVVVSTSDETTYSSASTARQVPFTITARQILAGETVTVPWHAVTPNDSRDVSGAGTVTLTHEHPSATVTVTVSPASRQGTEVYRVDVGPGTDTIGRPVIATPGAGTILVSNTPPTLTLPASVDLPWAGTMHAEGSFTDPDSTTWSATVDYGDGPKPLALSGKTFNLTHDFTDPGSHHVTVEVCDDTGGCGDAKLTVVVGQVSIGALTATEGTAFRGTPTTFTLPDPTATPADFAASIAWGDGTTSTGALTGDQGSFTVSGSHTYAEEGHYRVTTTVHRIDDPDNSSTVASPADVADAPLTTTGVNTSTANPADETVATFSDADPGGVTADYAATIDWGDGTITNGAIDGDGSFAVSGTHTYAALGPHTVTTRVCDIGGACASATSHLLVYATMASGSFVVGDQSDSGPVIFWGSRWAKANTLSGGRTPASFKGFTDTGAASCGASWHTRTGNSSQPPRQLPTYLAVLVSGAISAAKSDITGNVVHIVVVKTDPGYRPDPGHEGTGTVVATVC